MSLKFRIGFYPSFSAFLSIKVKMTFAKSILPFLIVCSNTCSCYFRIDGLGGEISLLAVILAGRAYGGVNESSFLKIFNIYSTISKDFSEIANDSTVFPDWSIALISNSLMLGVDSITKSNRCLCLFITSWCRSVLCFGNILSLSTGFVLFRLSKSSIKDILVDTDLERICFIFSKPSFFKHYECSGSLYMNISEEICSSWFKEERDEGRANIGFPLKSKNLSFCSFPISLGR